jgi:hypothetical protein
MKARALSPQRTARNRVAQADANEADYRVRLAEECRLLAQLTPEEVAMASGFEALVGLVEGWR